MEKKKKKAPLPASPFHKERPIPRAERSPDRCYSPYPPPSKDDYSGKYAGSWPLPPIYHRRPSHGLRVNWINKDGVVDKEQYITELFAAMEKHSVWSVHTSTRPQFGPNTIAEYELDPVFKDAGLDMSVYGYLLPLLGHKVTPAADAPNSSTQDTSNMAKKKVPLQEPPFHKEYSLPREDRSADWRYSPYPPLPKDYYSGKVGTTTGYWQSDDCSEVPVREVAALKIAEN